MTSLHLCPHPLSVPAGIKPGTRWDCPLYDFGRVLAVMRNKGVGSLNDLTADDVAEARIAPPAFMTAEELEADDGGTGSQPLSSPSAASDSGGKRKAGRPAKKPAVAASGAGAGSSSSSAQSASSSSAAAAAATDSSGSRTPFTGVLFVTYNIVARAAPSESERMENQLLLAVLRRTATREQLAAIQAALAREYAAADWEGVTPDGEPPRRTRLQLLAEWFGLDGEGGECWL